MYKITLCISKIENPSRFTELLKRAKTFINTQRKFS